MTDFERIRILIRRAERLRRAADLQRTVAETLRKYDPERIEDLAEECERRAKEVIWSAKHRSYNEARRRYRQPSLPYRKGPTS